ncbi:hypothetical protein OF83DRAFT_1113636 [Amylostereum chailletii]|nr:hypothetical protein OF83DRAFT_1113636 [Amylostereum chailletii]
MVVHSEKRLVWHPRGDNKFVVGGGSQITLYEWSPTERAIRHLTSQNDLQLMKCFAWSPDRALDDLIAIGLSNGRVDLLRLESTRTGREHVAARGPQVTLAPKSSRACTSLAFCPAAPHYLAVGLDKVRGDASLMLWDIHTATPALTIPTSSSTNSLSSGPNIIAPPPSPARQPVSLPPARASSTALSSSNKSFPHIPRMDLGPRNDMRILQAQAPAESVHALTWLPQSTHLLAAGLSHRWLRLFDLRNPATVTAHAAGRIQALAADPSDPHRLAGAADGIVTLWDVRKLSAPLLTFTMRDADADGVRTPRSHHGAGTGASLTPIASLEFSTVRRGLLATFEREASHVRFWNVMKAEGSPVGPEAEDRPRSTSKEPPPNGRTPKLSWTNPTSMLPWSGQTQSAPSELPPPPPTAPYNLVLTDTRKSRRFPGPLSSFALMPSTRTHPLALSVIAVTREGDLEVVNVHDTPTHAQWSARGTLAIAAGTAYRTFEGIHPESSPPSDPWDLPSAAGTARPRHPVDEGARGRTDGRSHGSPAPPMFGRGDADGFPALTSPALPQPSPRGKPTLLPKLGSSTPALRSPLVRNDELPPAEVLKMAEPLAKARKEAVAPRARSVGVSAGRVRRRPVERIQGIVDEDISMVMRRRAVSGYGLSDFARNASLFLNDADDGPVDERPSEDRALGALWTWFERTRHMLEGPSSRFNGFDFTTQGLLGIWEGFPSSTAPSSVSSPATRGLLLEPIGESAQAQTQATPLSRSRSKRGRHRGEAPSEFTSALLLLSAYHGLTVSAEPGWKPGVKTGKLIQRRFALELCGWSLKEEEFEAMVGQWEKGGMHSRAACWLVFTGRYEKAIDVLMRSPDESHKVMSGTLAALISTGNAPRSPELQQYYDRLIAKLDDLYFRAMLTHLALGSWADVLDEESLHLRERLSIALQFLEDDALGAYLRRLADSAAARGDVDGLIVTGLTRAGMRVLQAYVDRTGDVQTAAILGAYVNVHPQTRHDGRVDRWLEAYRDLLDGWKLFYHRCQLDIDRGQRLQQRAMEGGKAGVALARKQVLVRCNYCSKIISAAPGTANVAKPTTCPHCNRPLPRCSVCLMSLTVLADAAREGQLAHHNAAFRDTIDDAIVFCQTCRHGGHASHILDWFYGEAGARSHGVCAVADCDHRCVDEL